MKRWMLALRLLGMGWYVGICILLGVLGGLWLDNRLNTHIFIIIGLLLGIILAFYGFYRMLEPLINSKRNKGE